MSDKLSNSGAQVRDLRLMTNNGVNTTKAEKAHNKKAIEEKAYRAGKQGKTPGGIGFALTFLLFLFFVSRQRKGKGSAINGVQ